MVSGSLVTHCGGRKVELQQVIDCPTPVGTSTHKPIPHSLLREKVIEALGRQGFGVVGEEWALRDAKMDKVMIPGAQMFGLLRLQCQHEHGDYQLVAGLRNSHDKTMASALALGSRVFVCDNLAFSGEVTFERKHTALILADLPRRIDMAISKVHAMREMQDQRIAKYKGREFTDEQAALAIMKAATGDEAIISQTKIVKVWKEWLEPRHEAFKPRTAWSLFNSVTEVAKEYQVQEVVGRTQRLFALMDTLTN